MTGNAKTAAPASQVGKAAASQATRNAGSVSGLLEKAAKKAAAAKVAAPAAPAAKAEAPAQRACGCGCGETAAAGRTYRPGHDARHAGQVGRWMAANPEAPDAEIDAELAKLPTPALQAKARKFAENRRNEASRKEAAKELRARYQAELKAKLAELGA